MTIKNVIPATIPMMTNAFKRAPPAFAREPSAADSSTIVGKVAKPPLPFPFVPSFIYTIANDASIMVNVTGHMTAVKLLKEYMSSLNFSFFSFWLCAGSLIVTKSIGT
eukprot:CAMPEP_0203785912 /NCGR_PEP_ID=MMETSP0100_2-20121128/1301_1 /ASSEMBLY_ACC=CAM_ASM_000210 /TAXON_ID=96639 /ORGANISM=" , Strain NY0313808BC1" /LENGTH=107 /DNA_ID=CAMNT_0050688089 /DNA_START=1252 /DNA_END=1575 /DNA_ORIENTATION=-